jgi:nucleolar protein 9
MNVYREIDGHEISVAGDPELSHTMEVLLNRSSDFHLRVFFSRLLGEYILFTMYLDSVIRFEKLFSHQFASHVCQKLLSLAADVVHREQSGESVVELQNTEVELESMSSLILALCNELSDQWIEIFQQRYGSHVFRTLLNVLSGETLVKDEAMIRSNKSKRFLARKGMEMQPLKKVG